MLILGIETATEQVGVAIGGHEGVIATFEVTRGRRHAEILTPAIEFVCRQADIELDEIGCIAVDVGPGLFTGMRVGLAAGKALAQALRIPMIGITSLDLLAFPCRHTDRVVVPGDRRPQGRGVLGDVPPGARRRAAGAARPRSGPVDELVADLLARSQDVLCVGDGAERYRDEIIDGLPLRDRRTRCTRRSARSCSSPTRGPCARSGCGPSEIEPIYLRPPDAQINWSVREARP